MNNRLRIDIPNAKPSSVANAAGGIVVDALREAGIDPRKALCVPIIRQMAGMWGRGEWTRTQFVHSCRNVGIMNPSIVEVTP